MDRRFLRYFEQELRFLRDLAGEFALDHARVASRFGLDQDSCADPYVEWLLDGSAFLAARVQHKLDGEFDTFTHHLLEMLQPQALAPTPACAIVRFLPDPTASPAETGFVIPRREVLTSPVLDGEATRCTLVTAHEVTVWPLEIAEARYVGPAQLATAGLADRGIAAALQIRLRSAGAVPLAALTLDRLELHLGANDRAAHLLFEALVGHSTGVVWQDPTKPRAAPTRLDAAFVRRRGTGDDEALFLGGPDDPLLQGCAPCAAGPGGFSGERLLREYFTLPQRFLFVEIAGLQPALRQASGDQVDLLVLLRKATPALDGAVTAEQLILFATPVINLFRRRARPILVEPHAREHHVVADRVRPLDYEVYDVVDVEGSGADNAGGIRFERFWRTDQHTDLDRDRAFFAIERRPRIVSRGERQRGSARSSYLGSEVFLSLCDANSAPYPAALRRIDVDVLCTNRDLPLRARRVLEEVPFGAETGGPVGPARVVGRLTLPRPSPATVEHAEAAPWGRGAWQLAGGLALNHLSLVDDLAEGARALRSLLALHAASAEPATARHVDGVRSIAVQNVVRRLPLPGPIAFGRGLEVTLDLAESAFQEGSAFLLGSVLELYLRRHVQANGFVETVVRTGERGELMRWPARPGQRHAA